MTTNLSDPSAPGYIETRFDSMEAAHVAADGAMEATGVDWLACDAGPNIWPRYTIKESPKVGDKVSRSLNGDYSPDGEIVRISKTMVITTSTGSRYYRRGQSGSWRQGRTWWLVQGWISERNPHF